MQRKDLHPLLPQHAGLVAGIMALARLSTAGAPEEEWHSAYEGLTAEQVADRMFMR